MHLPDVNFWLALAFESHVHHSAAKSWLSQATRGNCCLCRVTQMGFLRLATNPKVLPQDVLSLADAWRVYDEMMSDERMVFADEPIGLEPLWRTLTEQQLFSTNVWTDAYLAAFAQAGGLEVVTFDRGFNRFKNVRCVILE